MDSRGDKIKAGKLLSKFLRQIADEETELVEDPNCGNKMATKAEAIARLMFKMALGYVEEYEDKVLADDGTEKTLVRQRVIRPDRTMIQLIWDRLEGKVGSYDDPKNHGLSLADRVDEAGKKRISAAGGLNEPGNTSTEADTT